MEINWKEKIAELGAKEAYDLYNQEIKSLENKIIELKNNPPPFIQKKHNHDCVYYYDPHWRNNVFIIHPNYELETKSKFVIKEFDPYNELLSKEEYPNLQEAIIKVENKLSTIGYYII